MRMDLKRWVAAALAVVMLFAILPMPVLANDLTPPNADSAADEVTYNTGRVEVTVGSDQEKADSEDLDIWYTLFDEDGGHIINLDLFDADPLFPYEVQFKYQGKTETRWFETIDDTENINGHVFSLFCADSQPRTIGFWVEGEYFPARPVEKEFTNEGGLGTFSMQPLSESRLVNVDLSAKLGDELKNVIISGGPTSGIWAIANSDNYSPFDSNTKIDLSPYMGQDTVTLELINGNDPLNSSLTRYIVT